MKEYYTIGHPALFFASLTFRISQFARCIRSATRDHFACQSFGQIFRIFCVRATARAIKKARYSNACSATTRLLLGFRRRALVAVLRLGDVMRTQCNVLERFSIGCNTSCLSGLSDDRLGSSAGWPIWATTTPRAVSIDS